MLDEAGTFTVNTARCNGSYEAWLMRAAAPAAPGAKAPARTVADHLRVRELRKGETFSSGPYCLAGGKEIQWLAVYEWGKRKRITAKSGGIHEAWVANPATGKFEAAPAALVKAAVCSAGDSE